MEKNWSYTIQEGEHKGITLWSGRYCTVCAIILCTINTDGKTFILSDKRGTGAPDFKGLWNLPCGFIEKGENGAQAASREAFEETGVFIYPSDFEFLNVETNPNTSNNGNITLRYISRLNRKVLPSVKFNSFNGGEQNEVEEIQWIPLNEIEHYSWAFHHKELIYKVLDTLHIYY